MFDKIPDAHNIVHVLSITIFQPPRKSFFIIHHALLQIKFILTRKVPKFERAHVRKHLFLVEYV